MDFYQKNLAAIRHNRTLLNYESLLEALPLLELGSLTRDLNGTTVEFSDGRRLFFSSLVAVEVNEGAELVMLQGFGAGEVIRALRDKPSITDILVYEADAALFKTFLSGADYATELSDPRVRVIFGDSDGALEIAVTAYLSEDLARLTRLIGFKVIAAENTQGSVEKFRHFQNLLHRMAEQHLANYRATPIEDSFRGLLNTARNFPRYFENPHLNALAGAFAGKTGIVVGTAPSLKHVLPDIKRYQDRLIVCAVDSVFHTLISEGIVPDYVVSLERILTDQLFAGCPELPGTYLVAPAVMQPATYDAFRGPKLKIYRDVGFENWFENPPEREFLGSTVSHLGYVVLRRLGCDTVLLAGQDFAYDPTTLTTYCDNVTAQIRSLGDAAAADLKSREVEKDGYGGGKQVTTPIWIECVQIMSELVVKHGGRVLQILPVGYGIPIPFTEQIRPDAAFANFVAPLPPKVKSEAALLSRHRPDPALKAVAGAKIKKIAENLRAFATFSLKAMREMSEFWLDYHALEEGGDLTVRYRDFFKRMETYHEALLRHDGGFFDDYFLQVITTSHALIGVKLAKLLKEETHFGKRVHGQMRLLFEWYEMIHLWSSRSLDLIENLNRTAWRFS